MWTWQVLSIVTVLFRAVESYIMLLMLPCYPEAATANFPEALETQRWVKRTNHATAILGND